MRTNKELTNMELTKREDVLKFAALVVAKDYNSSIQIIDNWLQDNPFDYNAMSQFKGNKNPNKKKKYLGSPQNIYQDKLLPILKAANSSNPKEELYKLFDGKGKINNISIFSDGNAKLKFLNFSTMPKVNCGGAGGCLSFCYSFKSLRNPNVVARWVANTILENHAFEILEDSLRWNLGRAKYRVGLDQVVDFRLYNDGDFQSLDKMISWFDILNKFPQLQSYAYSKSLHLFKNFIDEYGAENIPSNFVLNLSSGVHPIYKPLKKVLAKYDFVRGEFIGIDLGKKVKPTELTKEQKQELRQKAYAMGFKKAFACGGICQSCTNQGHACGMRKLKDVAIVTPIH